MGVTVYIYEGHTKSTQKEEPQLNIFIEATRSKIEKKKKKTNADFCFNFCASEAH